MQLTNLISKITSLDDELKKHVSRSANVGLTVRNWMIGAYIVEYEQNGEDRAEYGERVIELITEKINIKGLTKARIWLCRQFYEAYPQILASPTGEFDYLLQSHDFKILVPVARESDHNLELTHDVPQVTGEKLITNLSFTHFTELIKISHPLQRTFYEIESIRGNWSVRELKRQIGSLLYERTGLSTDKDKLIRIANEDSEKLRPEDIIKDPYVFEFLGLKPQEALRERDLETQLLDDIQAFLLELGHGFCFEERQKKIRIGETDYFIDLVFYHRKLHCNVLIELKVGAFDHNNAGQLNTYLNYYKKHEINSGDNPPIGLLLCTGKDTTLVEYALGGMDENMFVSSYKVALPDEAQLQEFLEKEARFLNH